MRGNRFFVNSYRRICCAGNEVAVRKPLIEICGQRRVLIEHHTGIVDYNHSKISVKVVFGCIDVHGEGLKLRLLSKEKLIITGNINSITLQQGCKI